MKILLITQGTSRLVWPLLNSTYQIIGIVESMPRNFQSQPKRRTLFNLIKTFYHRIKGKKVNLQKICLENNIPYNFISKGRDQEVTAWVKDLNPDLIVVYSMSQLLKEDLISIPKLGVINLHPSYLPEYRGPNPDFWQYYHMEMNPGATVHYIDKGEDTGDIIFQNRVHIPLGTKSPERLDKLIGELGVSLIFKALQSIEEGSVGRIKQPSDSPTERARNINLSEHQSLIDWEKWPIERTWHVLRGTELWLRAIPKPKGVYYGQSWTIEDFVKSPNSHNPGTIVRKRGRSCITVPEGYIYLSLKFSLKKLIISLLRK